MWSYESSKKQLPAFPIQELAGSPNEIKSSVCFVDLLHMVGTNIGQCPQVSQGLSPLLKRLRSLSPLFHVFYVIDMVWIILSQVEYLTLVCIETQLPTVCLVSQSVQLFL